jgi:DNA-binding MarR family transcriptional regulator
MPSAEATPLVAEDREFGFLINDVARLLRQRFDERAQALGLTRSQWRALAHIGRQEGMHQAALAEILEIEPISLARLIDRLEAGGFVERRHDPTDRRAWRLHLTPKAHPVFARMKELALETRAEAFGSLDRGKIAELYGALQQIKDNLASVLSERERGGLRGAGGRHG